MDKRKPDKKDVVFLHGLHWGPQTATQAATSEGSFSLAVGMNIGVGVNGKTRPRKGRKLTSPRGWGGGGQILNVTSASPIRKPASLRLVGLCPLGLSSPPLRSPTTLEGK